MPGDDGTPGCSGEEALAVYFPAAAFPTVLARIRPEMDIPRYRNNRTTNTPMKRKVSVPMIHVQLSLVMVTVVPDVAVLSILMECQGSFPSSSM